MDEAHAVEHQHLADLEANWAMSGDPAEAIKWKVSIRVHLAWMHDFEQTRDPETDHQRLHDEDVS